ncbi:MAG: hypothetical protein Q8K36_01760, partial [Alphaproteobacteria bacterium]|nr:hypothetical protein [Alphaproteobacteria bacterium]
DIQKNYSVQCALEKHPIKAGDSHYTYKTESLFTKPLALKTAVDVFYDRYKDQKITGIVATNHNSFALGAALSYLMGIPVMVQSSDMVLESNGYYIILTDIIYESTPIQKAIASIHAQQAHVVEVACLTEIHTLNARQQIQAPIFSIFIERFQKKTDQS